MRVEFFERWSLGQLRQPIKTVFMRTPFKTRTYVWKLFLSKFVWILNWWNRGAICSLTGVFVWKISIRKLRPVTERRFVLNWNWLVYIKFENSRNKCVRTSWGVRRSTAANCCDTEKKWMEFSHAWLFNCLELLEYIALAMFFFPSAIESSRLSLRNGSSFDRHVTYNSRTHFFLTFFLRASFTETGWFVWFFPFLQAFCTKVGYCSRHVFRGREEQEA